MNYQFMPGQWSEFVNAIRLDFPVSNLDGINEGDVDTLISRIVTKDNALRTHVDAAYTRVTKLPAPSAKKPRAKKAKARKEVKKARKLTAKKRHRRAA